MRSVDDWIARQDVKLDRSEAIRRLVETRAEGEEMSDPPRRRFMRPWKVIEHDESYEV
jgi:hypothetical protein